MIRPGIHQRISRCNVSLSRVARPCQAPEVEGNKKKQAKGKRGGEKPEVEDKGGEEPQVEDKKEKEPEAKDEEAQVEEKPREEPDAKSEDKAQVEEKSREEPDAKVDEKIEGPHAEDRCNNILFELARLLDRCLLDRCLPSSLFARGRLSSVRTTRACKFVCHNLCRLVLAG